MKGNSRIRWGRVILAAVLSEVLVVIELIAVATTYRFLIAPGKPAAEYDALNTIASYHVAAPAAGVAVFLGALWACRKLTSTFILNGTLVGIVAVVLAVGPCIRR